MEKIRSLKARINWEPTGLSGEQVKSYQGYIKAPSSYDVPQGKVFDLYVQRHMKVDMDLAKLHILFISGGPGRKRWSWDSLMKGILDDHPNAAVYAFDHRGLGKSGKLSDESFWKINFDVLSKTVPIDLNDITLRNVIYDVALIFEAIKNDPDFNKLSKFGVYGASYGALLGSQVVAYFPDLLDYSFLLSLPYVPSYQQYLTDDGITEACDLDPDCRRLLGGPNPRLALRDIIKKVTTQPLNFCSAKLFEETPWAEKLKKPVSQGRLNKYLIKFFHELLLDQEGSLKHLQDDFVQPMAVIAALKSTADCSDPALYAGKVLVPLLPYINHSKRYEKSNSKEGSFNVLINTLIQLDFRYFPGEHGPRPKTPKTMATLEPSVIYEKTYYSRGVYLSALLDRKRTVIKGINTRKTKVVILQGQMDLCTPYLPAYKFYESINSPLAIWGLFKNETHQSDISECHMDILNDIIKGNQVSSTCLDRENAKNLNWRLSASSKLGSLWDLSIPSASSSSQPQTIKSQAPSFQIRKGAGKTFVVVDPNQNLPSNPHTFSSNWGSYLTWGVFIIVFIFSCVGAFIWYSKWKKQNLNTTVAVV